MERDTYQAGRREGFWIDMVTAGRAGQIHDEGNGKQDRGDYCEHKCLLGVKVLTGNESFPQYWQVNHSVPL
jgi:hypothetical protein